MTTSPSRFLLAVLALAATACGPKMVTINVEPAAAGIYINKTSTELSLIGAGSASVVFNPKAPMKVYVVADGYEGIWRTLTPADATKLPITVSLQTRLVKITVAQPTAEIFQNGRKVADGTGAFTLRLERDESATIEAKRRGYRTVTKTYANRSGSEAPPAADHFDISERTVSVIATPSTGTRIEVSGRVVGEGSAQIIIPRNTCQNVRVVRVGFVPGERVYCQRDGEPEPPESETFVLRDRLVDVSVEPNTADIVIGGRRVGTGTYAVMIREGTCVDVNVQATGFLRTSRSYCNQLNVTPPGEVELMKLAADSAYAFSVANDQANVTFNIDVNPTRNRDDAWKLLAQIATQHFDVVEVTDKETGYLRTGWNVFSQRGTHASSVIRTRVIVKLVDDEPLKYSIKLQSEIAPPLTSVKEDEKFLAWDRIMLIYKDMINEAQQRLK